MLKHLAQSAIGDGVDPDTSTIQTLSADEVVEIFERFANWMFVVFLIVAVIAILIAAFKYLTAGGKETGIQEANRALIYAAVAIAVALLAKGLVLLVAELVG